MKQLLTFIFIIFGLASFGQSSKVFTVNKDAFQKLKAFKAKAKYEPNESYTGLGKPLLKSKLVELTNQSADEFATTLRHEPTEMTLQENIRTGLARFNLYYLDLDTEDREKVCSYFEELMDCVGLKSSNGVINKWLYGFDPNKK